MREFQFRIRVDRDKSNLEFDCKLEIEERKCMGRGKWVMSSHRNKKNAIVRLDSFQYWLII